jgi:hypothetical protein
MQDRSRKTLMNGVCQIAPGKRLWQAADDPVRGEAGVFSDLTDAASHMVRPLM